MSIPNLQAPNKNLEEPEKDYKGADTLILVFAGIIICLILIITVLLLSPSFNDKKSTEINSEAISQHKKKENKLAETPNSKSSVNQKAFNENSQIEWLLRKTHAEKNNMPNWATEDFNNALALAMQAEQFKQQENNEQAENNYHKATEIINKTLEQKQQRQNELLKNAEHALNKNELIRAKQFFKSAQQINPENEQLKNGLNRLENRYEVNKLYDQAMAQEKNEDIDGAINSLEKALILEPENKKVKGQRNTLMQVNKEAAFIKSISVVLNAIEKNDLNKAKRELQKAKEIKKTDPVIKELEERINESNKILVIKQLHSKAMKQERNENWKGALTSYQKILSYDADTSDAKTNQNRVKSYLYLNQLLDSIVIKPQRLQDKRILEKSKNTLVQISQEIKQKKYLLHPYKETPQLFDKITKAKNIVKNASMEIPVKIISDNETDIVIYKVGKFGKINEKTIILRPGQYTIVGSRSGYRDLRKNINISAKDKSLLINVKCQEKI